VNRRQQAIGGRREDGKRRLPLTGLNLPRFEESGEEKQAITKWGWVGAMLNRGT